MNVLHTALLNCYLQEIVNNPKDEYSNTELILISLEKLVKEKESIWPEICRLVLTHRLEETTNVEDGEDFDFKETFGPSDTIMKSII